jgi:hypothetical protein
VRGFECDDFGHRHYSPGYTHGQKKAMLDAGLIGRSLQSNAEGPF